MSLAATPPLPAGPLPSSPGAPASPRLPRLPRLLAGLLLVIAVAVPLGGVAYLVNGATHAQGDVQVPVHTRALSRLDVPLSVGPGDDKDFALRQTGPDVGVIGLDLPGDARSHGIRAEANTGTLTLRAWGSTITEQLTARGGTAVNAVGIGLGAFLMRGVLLSIAAGRPFERRNAGRLAGIAALIALAEVASVALPFVSAELVFHRIGLSTTRGAVVPPGLLPVSLPVHLLIALLVLALAAAFRRGGDMARDVEGLV